MAEKLKKEVETIQYSNYNELSEVAMRFGCSIKKDNFIGSKEFNISDELKKNLLDDFNDDLNFKNEFVICERLISPIISLISKHNNLKLWSHTKFNVTVDDTLEFSGSPDYLWAIPAVEGGTIFTKTIACLAEAKQDNFTKGWAQVGAEMVATQYYNNNFELPVFGLVSNGTSWEFGKLVEKTFIIDKLGCEMPAKSESVFNSLNWFLCEVRKNADILLEIEAKNTKRK